MNTDELTNTQVDIIKVQEHTGWWTHQTNKTGENNETISY